MARYTSFRNTVTAFPKIQDAQDLAQLSKTESDFKKKAPFVLPAIEKPNQRSISTLTNCKVSAKLFHADIKEVLSIASSGKNSQVGRRSPEGVPGPKMESIDSPSETDESVD